MAFHVSAPLEGEGKIASAAWLTEWSIRQAEQRLCEHRIQLDDTTSLSLRRRHQRITARINALVATHPQLVLLGGGHDTRALTLPAFGRGKVHIFEVDTYGRLAQKLRWLAAQGLRLPVWSQHIPVALDDPALPQRLGRAGFTPTQPTILVIESLFYLLPPAVTAYFLDPAWLPLAATSVLLFDCWTPSPLDTPACLSHPAAIQQTLEQLGYGAVQITPLAQPISPAAQPQPSAEPQPDWLLIEAVVGS